MPLKVLSIFLALAARLTLIRHKPKIIGITGNFGKTSAKEAILAVLQKDYFARGSEKNYNNEIGVPLAILGWPNYGRNVLGWLFAFVSLPFSLIAGKYPAILVLEMGADKPGDIEYLIKIAPPFAAVVTGVGETPVHVEFFASPEAVAEEKAKLVQAVPRGGFTVLNADDPRTAAMKERAVADVVTYGVSPEADYRIENMAIRYENGGSKIPLGISFKIVEGGSVVPLRLAGSLNRPQALAAAAAFAVGRKMGMNPVEIVETLLLYRPPAGRMRMIGGINGSLILDDSYNAAPAAVEAALETLAEISAERKIAVLGDMKELGEYSELTHGRIGEIAARTAGELVTVGENAKIIRDAALAAGFAAEASHHFNDSRSAGEFLKTILKHGDVALVKGAQSMRMERVVEQVMAEPEKARDLLVRQTQAWKTKA